MSFRYKPTPIFGRRQAPGVEDADGDPDAAGAGLPKSSRSTQPPLVSVQELPVLQTSNRVTGWSSQTLARQQVVPAPGNAQSSWGSKCSLSTRSCPATLT